MNSVISSIIHLFQLQIQGEYLPVDLVSLKLTKRIYSLRVQEGQQMVSTRHSTAVPLHF